MKELGTRRSILANGLRQLLEVLFYLTRSRGFGLISFSTWNYRIRANTRFASGGAALPNGWNLLFGEATRHELSRRTMPLSTTIIARGRATRRYVSPYHRALVYVGLGENDQAIAWLEKAV